MTGNKLDCAINTVAEDNGTLKWIHETYIRPPKRKKKRSQKNTSVQLTDDDLLDLQRMPKTARHLRSSGKVSGKRTTPVQSEADMALCCKVGVLVWQEQRAEWIGSFGKAACSVKNGISGIMPSGATYGEETLSKACDITEDVYRSRGDAAVFEYKGQYYRKRNDNIYLLTNFVFMPVEMIVAE